MGYGPLCRSIGTNFFDMLQVCGGGKRGGVQLVAAPTQTFRDRQVRPVSLFFFSFSIGCLTPSPSLSPRCPFLLPCHAELGQLPHLPHQGKGESKNKRGKGKKRERTNKAGRFRLGLRRVQPLECAFLAPPFSNLEVLFFPNVGWLCHHLPALLPHFCVAGRFMGEEKKGGQTKNIGRWRDTPNRLDVTEQNLSSPSPQNHEIRRDTPNTLDVTEQTHPGLRPRIMKFCFLTLTPHFPILPRQLPSRHIP